MAWIMCIPVPLYVVSPVRWTSPASTAPGPPLGMASDTLDSALDSSPDEINFLSSGSSLCLGITFCY